MIGRLPTFLVIGALRSGTTSLNHHLRRHPQVFMAPQKEIRFFNRHWDRGVAWYSAQFAGSQGAVAVGEATPSYLSSPSAAQRIAGVIPDARLVSILREPVARAYSHYWLDRELGIQTRSFVDAVEAEPALAAAAARGEDPRHRYLGAGRYLEHLQRFARHFSREAMLVLLFEDLRDDPSGTFATLCRFLGVDERLAPEDLDARVNAYRGYWSRRLRDRLRRSRPTLVTRALGRINQTRRRTYPPLDPALRERLRESFVEPNRALAAWLGRDLPAEWSV